MADEREPEQKSPTTGEEIPVPKRADVLRDLRKGAPARRKFKETIEPPPTAGDPGGTTQPPPHGAGLGY